MTFSPATRAAALSLVLLGLIHLPASGQKPQLSAVSNYALNSPGIVMIRTEYSANVYVNSMKMDNRAFNSLLDSIQNLDHGGGVTADPG